MIKHERVRAAMLMACLDLVPPPVRDGILSDDGLRRDFGIKIDAVLKFGDSGADFKRSKLFAMVRVAAAKAGKSQKILDQSGTEWEITAKTGKDDTDLILKSGQRTMHVGHLLMFSNNRSARLRFYGAEADRLNLPPTAISRWTKILRERPLSEEEIGEVLDEASHSPVAVSGLIAERLAHSNITLEALVPRTLDYYEQLVGRVEEQPTIKEYVDEVAMNHIRGLLAWREFDGLQFALLLVSHSLVTIAIAQNKVAAKTFDKLANWALGADSIARGAIIELALMRARDEAKIGESVQRLAVRFCGQGGEEKCDPFTVLSAAYVMVDGELGHIRIMGSKPPYWRRLAALAQAALITRCILSTRGDPSSFIGWMRSVRPAQYTMQGYVDLRSEPRWLSDFAMPRQLKDEIGGRVLMAAARNEAATDKLRLRDVLLSDDSKSLKSQLNLLFTQLPGPLEGNVHSVTELRAEDLDQMRQDLATPSPAVASFALLANAALLFGLPDDVPDLAAEAIRRAQYRLDPAGKLEALQSCLVGLAVAAAVNRSQKLADELFIVIRNYRRFFRDELPLDGAFRIGMMACASRSDLGEWCKCVGALVADLGFGELTREDAAALHPSVIELCDLVPELWAACGQGLAAIEAVGLS